MAKGTDKGAAMVAAGIVAQLEERGDAIKALEHMNNHLGEKVAARDRQITADREANERRIEALNKQISTYRELYETEVAKARQLQDIIATMDTKAIEKVRQLYSGEIHQKDMTIDRLKEDVHRALGWIAAQKGQHPIQWNSRPQDMAPFDKAADRHIRSMQSRDEVDEETPF